MENNYLHMLHEDKRALVLAESNVNATVNANIHINKNVVVVKTGNEGEEPARKKARIDPQ